MNIFVAGGSGTIGVPLVRALVEAGHRVTATTRSNDKRSMLERLGAMPVVVDALDANGLRTAVMNARPTHVIHQLTALPKDGPRSAQDVAATDRLRIDGTRNLIDASIRAGAQRIIIGSFVFAALADGLNEPSPDPVAAALQSMESQALDAHRRGAIEAVVLRYGLFYGPDVPSTTSLVDMVRRRRVPVVRHDSGQLPYIHIHDAVTATVAALDHGVPGRVYNVVDDRATSMTDVVRGIAEFSGAPAPFAVPGWIPKLLMPYVARMFVLQLPLSNVETRRDLQWHPAFPTWREGLSNMLARTA